MNISIRFVIVICVDYEDWGQTVLRWIFISNIYSLW